MHSLAKKIGYFSAFITPALVIIGVYAGSFWNYLTVLFAFVVLPLTDHFRGTDTSNIPNDKAVIMGDDFFYRFVTYLWTYVQVIFVMWGAYVVTSGQLVNAFQWIGFTLGFALVTGGIGITVAHELGHKKSTIERIYSQILLMTVCYMHFYIEHNRGHHVHVATPLDPATSKKNETFYAFWIRSVFGGYKHALKLEAEQLQRKGHSALSLHNRMLLYFVLPLLFCFILTLIMTLLMGRITWEVPLFFFAQSFIAITLLELVNYIEHYGIQRKELASGRYENVNPLHSWNSSHILSNFFLFQLQRHSDHHAYAYKRYQVLNHYDASPQLPFGYPTMIILALFPPLWFNAMNRRLEQWQSYSLTNLKHN